MTTSRRSSLLTSSASRSALSTSVSAKPTRNWRRWWTPRASATESSLSTSAPPGHEFDPRLPTASTRAGAVGDPTIRGEDPFHGLPAKRFWPPSVVGPRLVGASLIRLAGGYPSVRDGLETAFRKLGTTLEYATIAVVKESASSRLSGWPWCQRPRSHGISAVSDPLDGRWQRCQRPKHYPRALLHRREAHRWRRPAGDGRASGRFGITCDQRQTSLGAIHEPGAIPEDS